MSCCSQVQLDEDYELTVGGVVGLELFKICVSSFTNGRRVKFCLEWVQERMGGKELRGTF